MDFQSRLKSRVRLISCRGHWGGLGQLRFCHSAIDLYGPSQTIELHHAEEAVLTHGFERFELVDAVRIETLVVLWAALTS